MLSTSNQNSNRPILSKETDPLIWPAPIQIQNNNIHNNERSSFKSNDIGSIHRTTNNASQPYDAVRDDNDLFQQDDSISKANVLIDSYSENPSPSYISKNNNRLTISQSIPIELETTFQTHASSSLKSPLRNTTLFPKEEIMPEIKTNYIEEVDTKKIRSNSTEYFKDNQNLYNPMPQVDLDHKAISTTNDISSKEPNDTLTKIEGISESKPLLNIAEFPTKDLLKMLTSLLEKIVNSNDEINATTLSHPTFMENDEIEDIRFSVSGFYGKHIPQISIERYLSRIQKHCSATNDIYLSLLVYFDRISKKCNNNPNNPHTTTDNDRQHFVMDSFNIHRLLISAVAVSTKFFSDYFYSNARYARVGGIPLQEMNKLEIQFMVLCDFKLLIPVEELQRYADLLYTFWITHNEEQDPISNSPSP